MSGQPCRTWREMEEELLWDRLGLALYRRTTSKVFHRDIKVMYIRKIYGCRKHVSVTLSDIYIRKVIW